MSMSERSRRERFFGCLSRHAAPSQSLLGGCVGRRVPSDENVSLHAPFYRYTRHSQQYPYKYESLTDLDRMDAPYFRRQPASILSTTSKMLDDSTHRQPPYNNSSPGLSGNEPQRYIERQL